MKKRFTEEQIIGLRITKTSTTLAMMDAIEPEIASAVMSSTDIALP